MPKLPVRPFKRTDNVSILNAIRNERSSDFTNRIPAATKANIREVFDQIWDYAPARNEFASGLVNQIGRMVGRNISFENPLAKFKIGMLTHGDTIEEYAYGLVKAREYDPSRDYLEKELFGQETPEVKAAFHKRNRRNTYKITINEQELRAAFDSYDSDSLFQFVNQMMGAAQVSDNWDEFVLMASLFRKYYDADGFFKVNVPDLLAPSATKNDSDTFIETVREWAETLQFVSTHYNAAHMPVAVAQNDLELFLTPRAKARIDVKSLAAAFNIEYSDLEARTTIIPPEHFNIPGAQGVLTTRDFFMVADTYLETASQMNPAGRYTNHFWHHDQIISASPFAPALLLTTETGDVITLDEPPVVDITGLFAQDKNGNTTTSAMRGEFTQILGYGETDPEGGANDEVILTLVGAQSEFTSLSNTGSLFVGNDEKAAQLTVLVTSGSDPSVSDTLVLNVRGVRVIRTKLKEELDESSPIAVTPDTPTQSGNDVSIPVVTGVVYQVNGSPVTGVLTLDTDPVTVTAVPVTGYEFTSGATTSWEFDPE